jgi:hypothetical protein
MEQESPARKQLARDAKREALTRLEDAARTMEQYQNVVRLWNVRDNNRRRHWRRKEIGRPNAPMLHWDREGESEEKGKLKGWLDTVIPAPLDHEWWRQLLSGDFLDVIHDCPYELHELTTSRPVSDILKTLNENQLEVLYYWAIRQWTPQRIAAFRGQSDRNILKVYATLIEGLRKKLYERLPLQESLTFAQRQFVEEYGSGKLKTGKPKLNKGKKKHRS